MVEQEGEESFDFLKKYIREDSKETDIKANTERFESRNSGSIEIKSREGEEFSYSDTPKGGFGKKYGEELGFEIYTEEEAEAGPISSERAEFLKDIEKDSLSLDTCDKVSHDWKKDN